MLEKQHARDERVQNSALMLKLKQERLFILPRFTEHTVDFRTDERVTSRVLLRNVYNFLISAFFTSDMANWQMPTKRHV